MRASQFLTGFHIFFFFYCILFYFFFTTHTHILRWNGVIIYMINKNEQELKNINHETGTDDDGGLEGARQLFSQTTWRTEAMQIPLASVKDKEEQEVLVKCINMEDLSPEEHTILEGVLARYRPAIQKYKPLETMENYDESERQLTARTRFLQLLDEQEKPQELTVYYPLNNNEERKLHLLVKPVTDAQAILEVSGALELFKDYTAEETQVFTDYQNGKTQTPEEIAIAKKIEMDIAIRNADTVKNTAIEFLSRQTTFSDEECTYEEMKEIYTRMNIGILLLIFNKVKDLAHLEDVDTEKIFRDSD